MITFLEQTTCKIFDNPQEQQTDFNQNQNSIFQNKQYRSIHRQIMFLLFLVIAISFFQPSNSLGQVFNSPTSDQFTIIKVNQPLYFNTNNTYTITFTQSMKSQPKALVTYSTLNLDHNYQATPEIVSWFNIRPIDVQKTYVTIYSESNNQIKNPTIDFHKFDVMVSCVDEKYFQIVNWEYNGGRLDDSHLFFNIPFATNPILFNYCFSDAAHNLRQPINYMLSFNGFTGANWAYLSSDVNYYSSKLTMHIQPSTTLFTLYLYSDHRNYIDKYYLGFLFFCPNSYLLKRKYLAEMKTIAIGNQMKCMQFADFSSNFISTQFMHNYSYFITSRFIYPNMNSSEGIKFDLEFDLINTSPLTSTKYYYQVFKGCGRIEYNVFFIVQKFCTGGREYVQSTGSCICNNTNGMYEVGVVQCNILCNNGTFNFNNQVCKSCSDGYGVGCLSCDQNVCLVCGNLFQLAVNSLTCLCTGDRAIQNNACVLCSTLYDPHCITCDSVKCLTTDPNYIIFSLPNGTISILTCQTVFGAQCLTCTNSSSCAACDHNFIINSTNGACQCPNTSVVISSTGICTNCQSLWGSQCTACTQLTCLTCSMSFIVNNSTGICFCPTIVLNGLCITCQTLWGAQCSSCSNLTCLSCYLNFTVNSSSGSCYCPLTNSINSTTGYCFSCQTLFNSQCVACSETVCLACSNSYNIISGNCSCPVPTNFINSTTGDCIDCKTKYTSYCKTCNDLVCLACQNGYVLNSPNTGCIVDNNITSSNCSLFDSKCLTCTLANCATCEANYQLNSLNNTCQCKGVDRIQFINQCYLCSQIYGNGCAECTNLMCTKCKANWTQYALGACICQKPNQLGLVNSENVCVQCADLYSHQKCTLKALIKHIQIGDTIFIQLSFNHPFEQITQVVEISQNLLILQDGEIVSIVKWHKDQLILQIPLLQNSQITNTSTLNISFINPSYIKWNSIQLSNQPPIIKIYPYDKNSLSLTIIDQIGTIFKWAYPITILASLGYLNFGFQMWFIVSYYLYINSDLIDNGYTQNLLLRMNRVKIGEIIPSSLIPHFEIEHKGVDFKEKIFQMNKGVLELTQQILFLYLLSVGLAFALGKYIKKKSNWHKYGIYINYLTHFQQYIISNFHALYPFLCFCITIQFQNQFNTNWSMSQQNIFANTFISISFFLIIMFVPFIAMSIYPPLKKSYEHSYSIVYGKIHPCSSFVFIEHFFRVFKGVIFVSVIFISRGFENSLLAELVLIGCMLMCLFLTVINSRKYVNKMYWVINMLKVVALIGFQVAFLFLPQGQPSNQNNTGYDNYGSDKACFIIAIILILSDFIQLIIKSIQIILTNKYNWQQININSNKIVPLVINIDQANEIIQKK